MNDFVVPVASHYRLFSDIARGVSTLGCLVLDKPAILMSAAALELLGCVNGVSRAEVEVGEALSDGEWHQREIRRLEVRFALFMSR